MCFWTTVRRWRYGSFLQVFTVEIISISGCLLELCCWAYCLYRGWALWWAFSFSLNECFPLYPSSVNVKSCLWEVDKSPGLKSVCFLAGARELKSRGWEQVTALCVPTLLYGLQVPSQVYINTVVLWAL